MALTQTQREFAIRMTPPARQAQRDKMLKRIEGKERDIARAKSMEDAGSTLLIPSRQYGHEAAVLRTDIAEYEELWKAVVVL